MAQGVNKAILIGNLGRDPELRYTQSGTAVCTFTIATTERWTDRGGERQEKTEWHRIVAWSALGENCSKFLSKGRQVYVEGRIQTREWEDRDGNTRYTTEINARDVQFLGSRGGGDSSGDSDPSFSEPSDGPSTSVTDDDIPF